MTGMSRISRIFKIDIKGYQGISRDIKGYQGISRDIEGYRGISRDIKGCQGMSRETELMIRRSAYEH